MTPFDDLDDVPNHIVPEELAEHLLAGGAPPAEIHETVAATATVLRAAAGPATVAEQAAADRAADAFARTVALTAATPTAATTAVLPVTSLADRRRRRLGGLPGRIAAGVVVATLCSAGAAAAATGRLPDPLQRTVAGAASHVGLTLPDPRNDGHGADDELADGTPATTHASTTSTAPTTTPEGTSASTTTAEASTSSSAASSTSVATDDETTSSSLEDEATKGSDGSTPVGPNAEGPAKKGLCTAYAQHQKNGSDPNGVAFASLRMAAEAKGMTVLEFCADVLPPTTGSSTPGASSSVPKPKGPPATIKGPDEPVDSTIANATMPTNTPAVTVTVKPGNGKGGGNPNG